MDTMTSEVQKITPEKANELLSRNDSNRTINWGRVNLYADILRGGGWKVNGESIKISANNRLLDGQHRLKAIVQSGIPMTTLVIKGVSEDVFDTIDTGKIRSGGDTLKVAGVENSTNISSGIILYKSLTHPRGIGHKIDNQSILTEYLSNPSLYQGLQTRGAKFYKKVHRTFSPADYIAFFRYFQTKHSVSTIEHFFESVEEQTGIGGMLQGRLLDNLVSKKKMQRRERHAIIIKAFNFFLSGKTVKILKFSIEEKFPTLE